MAPRAPHPGSLPQPRRHAPALPDTTTDPGQKPNELIDVWTHSVTVTVTVTVTVSVTVTVAEFGVLTSGRWLW
jgi:hypothetical protein